MLDTSGSRVSRYKLFGQNGALGKATQLVYGYGLGSTKTRMLDLIESRAAFRLMDIKPHPAESHLCLTFAEHAIKTHGVIPFYLTGSTSFTVLPCSA
jgi:hypothetical protein